MGLHSLPGAEPFYRRLNMNECGPDAQKEGLIYFEWYTPQSAEFDWEDEIDWGVSSSDEEESQ